MMRANIIWRAIGTLHCAEELLAQNLENMSRLIYTAAFQHKCIPNPNSQGKIKPLMQTISVELRDFDSIDILHSCKKVI